MAKTTQDYENDLKKLVEDAVSSSEFSQSRAGKLYTEWSTKRINKLLKEFREHQSTDPVVEGIRREINVLTEWLEQLSKNKGKGQKAEEKLNELQEAKGEVETSTPSEEDTNVT